MNNLNWYWVYVPNLDVSDVHEDSALKAGYDKVVFKSEADKVIAAKDAEIARLTKCCKEYDSRQRIDERIKFNGAQQLRATKRALWLAKAEMARTSAWVFWNRKDDYNYNKWKKVEREYRAKAKEYK